MNLSYTLRRYFIFNIKSKFNRSLSDAQNFLEVKGKQQENPLDSIRKDMSEITPYFPESFNLSAYINSSQSLQNLLHLNINLSKIEKQPHIAEKILKLDFNNDMKDHILFLKDYVDMENIGLFITKNPLILCQSIEDLQVRLNYLESKHFSADQIKQIISRNPFWLMFSTLRIDKRLGYFQQKFNLVGKEIRQLVTRQPKIITYNLHHINTNSFVIKEEMGFNDDEIKFLILNIPKLWMLHQKSLLERFNYLHNVIKIQHDAIMTHPKVLLCRNFRIKQRHLFLKSLGRAQYESIKENYVPITALYEGTDVEFCRNYGKCHIDNFNMFLKTL
ncbi:transcription termination factor 3, mitochondrial [Pararge aegeria]|uniref:Jg14435 protein n=2 Tax=Pararge aegeria TaxID=116150 RepID=A0A8S4RYZ2_9NEOP|nr:transcription termination factor 3, mitochondrial [Pararge aegeria]CAH2243142.1 jg14435 [Pararge aegeria aegeria]